MKFILTLIGSYLNFIGLLSPRMAGKQAFFLFCTPFAAKVKAHQAKFLDSAEKSWMQFEGKQVQLYKWGRGSKKILCVHGWQSNSFQWKRLIESIDLDEYTVFAADAPAHGNSEGRILNVPMYARFLSKYFDRIGKVHTLVTHSIGGFSAMYMMSEHPDIRPDQAVIIASPGNAEEFFDYFNALISLSPRCQKAMRAYFHEYVGKPVSDFQTVHYGPKLRIPGLIIHDREDQEVPFRHAENLHRSWPYSELILTSGNGHKMKAAEVIKSVLDFIAAKNLEKQNTRAHHQEIA